MVLQLNEPCVYFRRVVSFWAILGIVLRVVGIVMNTVASCVLCVEYYCSVGHVVLVGGLFLNGGDTWSSWIEGVEER